MSLPDAPPFRRTRIKFCGTCRPEDARRATEIGADAVGMILHARNAPRMIEAEVAKAVAAEIGPMVARVGVFKDARAPFVAQCVRGLRLDFIQLHGEESFDYLRALPSFRVIRAIRVSEYETWATAPLPNLAAILLDSGGGGTGEANDWDAIEAAIKKTPPRVPIFLAGGLRPETVGPVVERFGPYLVDVSSGIEERMGEKSPAKMSAFATAVGDADARLTAGRRPASSR